MSTFQLGLVTTVFALGRLVADLQVASSPTR